MLVMSLLQPHLGTPSPSPIKGRTLHLRSDAARVRAVLNQPEDVAYIFDSGQMRAASGLFVSSGISPPDSVDDIYTV